MKRQYNPANYYYGKPCKHGHSQADGRNPRNVRGECMACIQKVPAKTIIPDFEGCNQYAFEIERKASKEEKEKHAAIVLAWQKKNKYKQKKYVKKYKKSDKAKQLKKIKKENKEESERKDVKNREKPLWSERHIQSNTEN